MNYQYLNQGINIFYEEIFMIKKTKHLFLLSFLFVELLSYGAVDETFHYLKKDFFSQFNLGELKKISSCKIIKKFKELERIFLQFKDEDLISFIEKLDTEPYCSKNILLSTCYDSQEILFSFFEKAVEKIEKGSEDFGYIPFELPNLIEEREDILIKKIKLIQGNILRHINENLGYRNSKPIHILSDVDDTLYTEKGLKGFFAGVDKSFPAKEFYPGLLTFHRLLNKSGFTSITTARPKIFEKGMRYPNKISKYSVKLVNPLRKVNILTGAENFSQMISNLFSIIFSKCGISSLDFLGEKKYKNIKKFKKVHPYLSLVFIGDNGQGDLFAAKKLLREKVIDYAFIHAVNGLSACEEEKIFWDQEIVFFDNYAQLAQKISSEYGKKKLLNSHEVREITEAYQKGCQENPSCLYCLELAA